MGLDHEVIDAKTFADWNVDYVKYDNCNTQNRPVIDRYRAMGEALKATGRPIVFAVCDWGMNKPWKWGREVGTHQWRTAGNIGDNWATMTRLLDRQAGLESFAGPSGWNDPDMLAVGHGGMSDDEYRAHFALWSLLNAPLTASNDLRSMSPATHTILTNRELIAVNQDWAGAQGRKVRDDGDQEIWTKRMSDGSVAVALFNRGPTPADIVADPPELGLNQNSTYHQRDLWTGTENARDGAVRSTVPPHGATVLRIWPLPMRFTP